MEGGQLLGRHGSVVDSVEFTRRSAAGGIFSARRPRCRLLLKLLTLLVLQQQLLALASAVLKPDFHLDAPTHTHPLSGTTQVYRYQKGQTNLDFSEARDSEWQWHQLGRMPVCTSLQADNVWKHPDVN